MTFEIVGCATHCDDDSWVVVVDVVTSEWDALGVRVAGA